jgi:hypothetical protein
MSASGDVLFHRPGLVYFWVLNDRVDEAHTRWMARQFADAKVAAVCLHPRAGLELPYGGSDWFERITAIVRHCRELNLQVWLYDEDPYPSGAAGGRLLMDHPHLAAHRIERDAPDATLRPGDLFCFAPGKLLWCGLIDEQGRGVVDWTARVGVLRRQWTTLPQWDSRYYYPQTPRYDCPRAWTHSPELALRIPEHDSGAELRLVAFTARPTTAKPGFSPWSGKPDPLNPDATAQFLAMTHERYRQVVGEHFGGHIPAIFTDEPKWHDPRPYTPGLFEDFQRRFGEPLVSSLEHLFSHDEHEAAMITRLRYRQWCGERFRQCWLEPVARWCDQHRLALVGHISPEDDPIQQSANVGNLLPLMRSFTLPGLDLIIPAVGDADHPLINLGVVSATSVRAQTGKAGVLSESLACSGQNFTAAQAQRILAWQTVMGVTTVVVHAAYQSQDGHRAVDAPPDFGPLSSLWPDMGEVAASLSEAQGVVRSARQVAPVAILWPIASFMALHLDWQDDRSGLRADLAQLLLLCLQRQVGVHLLDEEVLQEARVESGRLIAGEASYSHVLVPRARVWQQISGESLARFMAGGGFVAGAGRPAPWMQTSQGLRAVKTWPWPTLDPMAAVNALPRLLDEQVHAPDLRCTAWRSGDEVTLLMTHLSAGPRRIALGERAIDFIPGRIAIEAQAALQQAAR